MCVREWIVGLASVGVLVGVARSANGEVITHGGTSVTMDFVTVGDAGNTADTRYDSTGYGAVGYDYNISTYEVSENQWDTVSDIAGDLLTDSGYWGGAQPAASINWHEAAMFCNWLTSGDVTQGAYTINGSAEVTGIDRASALTTYGTAYFIPTENEWYKAAYYKGGGLNAGYWDYPTQHDLSSPPDGIDYDGDTTFDAVFPDDYDQDYPNNANNAGVLSAYGTMGQGGNVWEWTEDVNGSYRTIRGGSQGGGPGPINLRASTRFADYSPTFENSRIGFRVASTAVPEPSTLIALGGLLGMGLIGCWWRRRKAA